MKVYVLLCLLILTLSNSKAQHPDQDIVRVGNAMPEFTIVSDDGAQMKSSSLKGKVVLINFFATWCPPCQKELAEIQSVLWPKYGQNKDFVLLVIGREHTDADLKKYNEKKGFTFPLYPDKDRAVYGAFAKSLIPRCYLVGKDGKVIFQSTGFDEADSQTIMDKIELALKK